MAAFSPQSSTLSTPGPLLELAYRFPLSFTFLLLNHQHGLAWTMCMNESSLLNEGQGTGPVFIPSEFFTKLPRASTQSKPSNTDRARPSLDNGSALVDNRSQLELSVTALTKGTGLTLYQETPT